MRFWRKEPVMKVCFIKIDCEMTSKDEREEMIDQLMKILEKNRVNNLLIIPIDSRMNIQMTDMVCHGV